MTVKELRINNWVSLCIAGEVWTERQLQANEFLAAYKHPEWIKPIPINEEWLQKFGFEKLGTDVFKLTLKGHCGIYFEKSRFALAYGYYMEDSEEIDIRYVHQLQNLYFALMGKEVQLK